MNAVRRGGERAESTPDLVLEFVASQPIQHAEGARLEFAAKIKIGRKTCVVAGEKQAKEVPGLCFDRMGARNTVHPRGRSGYWNFRLLWWLARRGGIAFNEGPCETTVDSFISFSDLLKIPATSSTSDVGGLGESTIREALRVYRRPAPESPESEREGTHDEAEADEDPGSRILSVERERVGVRIRKHLRIAIVVPMHLLATADALVLGAELAQVIGRGAGLETAYRAGRNDVSQSSAESSGLTSSSMRVAGLAHAQDRVPPFEVQRKTDGMTLVDVAIRAGQKPCIVALVGEAGLGKSATLAAAFFRWTEDDGWGAFAQCALDSEEWAASPDTQLESLLGVPTHAWIERATAEHKVPAVFFDTLDRITGPRTATAVVRFLVALVRAGGRVFVSCRTTEMSHVLHALRSMSSPCESKRIDLPRFGASEIAEFVKQFTEPRSDVLQVDEFVAGIAELADRPQMVAVLGVPLLLSMTCRVYCGRGEIPQDLTLRGLYDAVYNNKVCEARGALTRHDEASDRELVCARVSASMLKTSGEVLQVWVNPFAQWATSDRNRDALGTLVSEGIFERHGDFGLRYFHQAFAEYMIGRLLNVDAELRRTYLDRFADDPAAHHWLAPILRFALTLGGRRVINDAIRVLPLHDELALRPLALAMAEAAPELLHAEVARAATPPQRLVLVEALSMLDAPRGIDIMSELLSLARRPDVDEASVAAVRAMAVRAVAAADPVAATRQSIFLVRQGHPSPRGLEDAFVAAIAREPGGMVAIAGLSDTIASFDGSTRSLVAGAVAVEGAPVDVERALSCLVGKPIEGGDAPYEALLARHFLEVSRGEARQVADAITGFFARLENSSHWSWLVTRVAATHLVAFNSREVVECLVLRIASFDSTWKPLTVLLKEMARNGGASLAWHTVRGLPSWRSTPGARALAVVLISALEADAHLDFDGLDAAEQAAVRAIPMIREPEPGSGGRAFRPPDELYRDLLGPDVPGARHACGELLRMAEAEPERDVVDLLAPALRAPDDRVRLRAMVGLYDLISNHQRVPADVEAALALLVDVAVEAEGVDECSGALELAGMLGGHVDPSRWLPPSALGALARVGARLRDKPVLRSNGHVVRGWIAQWREWMAKAAAERFDLAAWQIFSSDLRTIDVGVSTDGVGDIAPVIESFFGVEPERALALLECASDLPVANVLAIIRAATDLDEVRECVLAGLVHDARDEVRRAVSRARLGMGS